MSTHTPSITKNRRWTFGVSVILTTVTLTPFEAAAKPAEIPEQVTRVNAALDKRCSKAERDIELFAPLLDEPEWMKSAPAATVSPERAQIIAGPTRFTRRPDGRFVSG